MRTLVSVLLLSAVLALPGCGGDDHGTPVFSAQVTFGDSLSDVGTYAVGTVRDLGGGKFTINGDYTAINPALTGKNWTEVAAAQLGLPPPCASQTGLQGDPARGLSVPVVNHAGCFGYAQGGARVTNPVGPGNAQTGSPLGALTVPVATQIQNHLAASGGSFGGDEIVFVMAGGNDAIVQLSAVGNGSATPDQAVAAMATAANELAELVKTQVVGKGANFVVVNNLPDLASAPLGRAGGAALQQLAAQMVATFNGRLSTALAGDPRVLYVDIYALTHDQVSNPIRYGLSNTATPACGQNLLDGSSLLCNATNTLPGVDVSHYMFADSVHATPFEYSLVARHVLDQMAMRGWLSRRSTT